MGDPLKQVKGLFFLLLYSVTSVDGEIRCYCNESGCVTTGYMCKSQLGMCYSHVKYKDSSMDPSTSTIVSGCADTLQEEPRIRTCAVSGVGNKMTQTNVNATTVVKESNDVEIKETVVVEPAKADINEINNNVDPTKQELICCTLDMCNYRDSYELSVIIEQAPDRRGSTDGISSKRTHETPKPQKDLWFKAAVIAVPIAGGFILILLVLLAVRMLRTDSRQHKRLIQIRRERSLTKAQLYVTDHFIDKDKSLVTNDNQIYSKNHSHAQCHSQSSKRDHNHSHRHSNCHHHHHKQCHPKVTTDREGHTYEQIVSQNSDTNSNACDHKCSSTRTSPYPSVIVWGKSNETDSADVV
ncbi:BMP and activin membrane-bound inhibitor homolog [Mercenaria mercenaria]|uniref:BMP and activin membrane-bound inhibitor homolog n=1 Tax=Mercenaria mercenaria TaxID=6596 RepID=UPI00234E3E95|nr:BMP and activin membrane-bound inhibitor homolog [Mercenaria mercenaria]